MSVRMRHKKNADIRMERCACVWEKEPELRRGSWRKSFNMAEDAQFFVEFGCGKGAFTAGLAAANPDTAILAVERCKDVIVMAMEKAVNASLTNAHYVMGDITELLDSFDDGEVDRLYINFCDPWPKKRHTDRRLTYRDFLAHYARILKDDGEIQFKTDNRGLFEFSISEFSQSGYALFDVSLDLHSSDFEGNIMTEYEKQFSERGQPIYRLVARKIKK